MAAKRLAKIANHLSSSRVQKEECVPFDTSNKSEYIYTLDETCDGVLTADQRRSYEENGFLVIRKLIDEADLKEYEQRFLDVCDGTIKRPFSMTVMKDVTLKDKSIKKKGQRVITKIQSFQDDKILMKYCKHPNVLKYMSCFIGPNIQAMHTMLINKPPDTGKLTSRHPLHQDLWYFPFRPTDRIACAWTAMQKIDRTNGGLSVIPGTHKRSPGGKLLDHGYPDWEGGVNYLYHGIKNFDNVGSEKLIHLDMEAGDCVFFHPLLIHGSGANKTDRFRKAISVHCCKTDCEWIDMSETVQIGLLEEFQEQFKKRGLTIGPNIMTQGWKLRGRTVQGV